MSKLIASLLVIGLLFGTNTYAQNKPIACQIEASSGLNWENGRWVSRVFIEGRFILVLEGANLVSSSVEKALNGAGVTCQKIIAGISCYDQTGAYILFNNITMKGAIAKLFGGISSHTQRDSLVVSSFTCQPF